jgi:hypothetical protein
MFIVINICVGNRYMATSRERTIFQHFQAFRKCAEKYLCWAEFCVFIVLSGLPCKYSGCQGATYVLYVPLDGKKVSCLQSEGNALFVRKLFESHPCERESSAKESSHWRRNWLI